MAKAKKKKYSASDKAILGIGYVLLGAFVLSILVPLLYVVIASFMDPNVLNSQGISFDVRKWTIDAYRRVLENNMIWRGFANSFFYSLVFTIISVLVTLLAAVQANPVITERSKINNNPIEIRVVTFLTNTSCAFLAILVARFTDRIEVSFVSFAIFPARYAI